VDKSAVADTDVLEETRVDAVGLEVEVGAATESDVDTEAEWGDGGGGNGGSPDVCTRGDDMVETRIGRLDAVDDEDVAAVSDREDDSNDDDIVVGDEVAVAAESVEHSLCTGTL
jgi:hypothetical protein